MTSVEAELVPFELDIKSVLNVQINKQINRATNSVVDSDEDSTEKENDDMTDEIVAILLLLMMMRGKEVYNDGVSMASSAGLDTSKTSQFDSPIADRQYTNDTIKSFNSDTAALIAEILASGKSSEEIKKDLDDLKSSQEFRINRYALNESWRASELASSQAMVQLEAELLVLQAVSITKTWNNDITACSICVAHSGETVLLNDKFSGGIEQPPLHVSCRCWVSYTIGKVTSKAAKDPMGIYSAKGRFLGKKLGNGKLLIKSPDKHDVVVEL